ncbi:MAG: hypothetical protein ACI9P5_002834 [Saprospiraceae bacterium]|jgi:hypothetical protein
MGILFKIFRVVLVIVLPFLLLIRGSISIHTNYSLGAWMSLAGGAVLTALILFIYMTFIYRRLTKKIGDKDNLQRRSLFAVALVGVYCAYGLFFISSGNMKNPSLQKEITEMHPILRMGISTFILIDKNMIITDASRVPEDYKKMGLKTAKSTLHYKQKDGYAYAIDLRTNGRNEFRNKIMSWYFKVLGFRTLRHVGTDDHLHVSLYCHYRPGGR